MIEVERRRRSAASVELTPLIDVVFQLLVFFLLTTTFTLPAVRLDLPEVTQSQEPREKDTLVLSMTKEGQLFIEETPLPEDALDIVVKQRLEIRPYQNVLVRGDVQARYGLFMKVLDACRKAGAERVLLETKAAAP